MLRKLLLIFMLICVTRCKRYSYYSVENLYAILDRTTEYFKNFNNVYEPSNADTSNIDDAIAKYMETTTKSIKQRQRRTLQDSLQYSEEVNVLHSFEEDLSISNLSDIQDVAFVFIQDGHRLLWLAAAINSSKITLFQLFDNTSPEPFLPLDFYPQSNGKRIIVNNDGTDIVIVVQTNTDEIVILRLDKTKNDTYEFHFKQEFEISGVMHINMWFGMNQLYLGIASDTKVFLYVWLGEHFDQVDTLHHGAREMLFFRHKSFMHIVVVGFFTRIYRFSMRSNKFIEIQKLNSARDASLFYFKEGHFEEHFLALANDNSTILYKEMYNCFVPFQKITPTRYVYSLMMENTVLLLAVTEKENVVIYQYNGWRFVELHVKLSNILQIREIRSHDKSTLVVQTKSGEWKFLRPIWTAKKTWQTLKNEVETWCSEVKRKMSQRSLKRILDLKSSVMIPNAYVGQLRTQHINNHNATELIRLTKQYKKTISKLNLAKQMLTQKTSTEQSIHTILHGKKVTVQCKTKCHVYCLNIDPRIKLMYKSRKVDDNVLKFTNLKTKVMSNWKCPIPNFAIDDILIKESVNGMLMENLQKKTLKISGDQEISGEHFFSNLNVTSISIPLNIATHNTSATLQINEAKVEELSLVKDEFFLPLNSPTTTMTGSITAGKVKVIGLIEMKGKITGKNAKKLTLLKDIYTPLRLPYDCFLQKVTFRNLVRVKDIVSTRKLSLKQILEDSIPLDSDVPKHVMLFNDKIQWNKVTILDYQNWVTKNSTDTIIISGAKFAINNVILTNAVYENLPIPKLAIPICAVQVVTQDIMSSLVTVEDLVVKHLYVQNVTGAYGLNDTMFGSVSALQSIDFSTKLFTGQVFVKNILVSEVKEIDARELKSQLNKWIDVEHIKGPLNVSKLFVKFLQTPTYFNLFLPTIVNTVIILGNSNIRKINNVDILSFIENVHKVDDKISLEYTIFPHGFASNHIHTSYSTLNVSYIDTNPNLHSKWISNTLETSAINVPQSFGYVASNVSPIFIIEGTAIFEKEPAVQNIKDVNLEKLSKNLWISDQDTVISGSNMYLKNMSIKTKVIIRNISAANSLNINVWLNLSNKLLSKTKQQNIIVAASFKNIVVPTVIATNNSILQVYDFNLNRLLTNSLMRNSVEGQIVDATWNFEELIINNLYWNGKFNDIDLNTDIVRYDTEQNIITGKKTVVNLSTKHLWSYDNKFLKFVKYALTEKCSDVTTIKGRKTFKNISLNNLSVNGKLMGHSIEQALLKYGNQTIFGSKRILGHLDVSSLITDSTVNDVFLTELINNQLKKRELVQTIEMEINFWENLEVFGNITIDGLYADINLNNISDNSKLDTVLNRMAEVMELADNIKTGLHNSATYINKFEEVDEDILETIIDSDTENVMALNSTCVCESKDLSQFCNDTTLLNILAKKNSSMFIMTSLVLLDNTVAVIVVSSDFVSVYTYAVEEQELYRKAELHIPGILQASVESAGYALWIALRLPRQTLVLSYQAWNEFEQYVLPASDTLVTSKTPNNQHLLILSDGVWNLKGVFHPERICKLPLNGEIKAFSLGADYYVKVTKKNSTTILKARYVGN